MTKKQIERKAFSRFKEDGIWGNNEFRREGYAQGYEDANSENAKEIGELKKSNDALLESSLLLSKEIERLKGLVESAFGEGVATLGNGWLETWQQFKTENKL